MDHVGSTLCRDPKLDEDGKPTRILQKQYKGYQNKDPNQKQQKVIPFCIIKQINASKSTEKEKATSRLITGAIFFAMRSCEYIKVSASEQRRTKVLTLQNIRFFQHGNELPHDHPEINTADTITITFIFQKNDERNENVTMHCTLDLLLCPVKSFVSIVRRTRQHKSATDSTPVYIFTISMQILEPITSDHVTQVLRGSAALLGEDRLGFTTKDIGTHFIHSGAAMTMYLDNVPVYTIMIIGRWSSDAFLRYIRKQVEQFSHNVSSRMIKHRHFYHIPIFNPQSHRLDTRAPNNPNNFGSRANISGASSTTNSVMSSRFALWT